MNIMENKNILLFGATGKTGAFIYKEITSRKMKLSVFVRKGSENKLEDNGGKIISGDEAGIVIENGNGEQIAFDIMIPTPRGAIMACRSVQEADIQVVSTDAGTSMSIQKAHGLL